MQNPLNADKMNLKDYFRIGTAARFLGTHADSLRRWERRGKIRVYRHPVNGYRLFLRSDLEKFLQEVQAV